MGQPSHYLNGLVIGSECCSAMKTNYSSASKAKLFKQSWWTIHAQWYWYYCGQARLQNLNLKVGLFETRKWYEYINSPMIPISAPIQEPTRDQYLVFSDWALSFSWESRSDWDRIEKASRSLISNSAKSAFRVVSSFIILCSSVSKAR